ncbi:hypothetical protein K435DRAFT_158247 [Dendrothele bispora CBS 962.96]|uniref:DUF6534 domain-containing protein n=1 Tax=Dendrothele bispora (strain CBS 962.96) TaxID=1314807 RepID=A0A4S8MNX6_DENBC|nr:hypothetical protein K435DRAFT_158247 [Dendrothele bispora CBS 962.96]
MSSGPPPISMIFGPMLVGVFLNCILYGVLSVQTYKKDNSRIKALVWYLYILETLNTGFDMGMMIEPLIVRYATERAVTRVPIMLSADPIVTVLISTPVQIFMAWRIKVISKSSLLMWIIIFFSICSFIGGVANTIAVTIINEFAHLHQFDGSVITWLGASAITDILITVSLVWSLWKARSHVRATDDAVSRIIRLTVQTGAITAVSAALDVILFITLPNTTVNFVWDFALSKLYTNALMSTLNARAGWGNLNGQKGVGNSVLFGNEGSSAGSSTRYGGSSAYNSRGTSRNPEAGIITTGVYELDVGNQWAQTQSQPSTLETDKIIPAADLESGIVVQTIVNTLTDPAPQTRNGSGPRQ